MSTPSNDQLSRALAIVRESELDQQVKLGIIELLSQSDNQELVLDLVALLVDWDEADNQETEAFSRKMKDLAEQFAQRTEKLRVGADSELEETKQEGDVLEKISRLAGS